MPALSAPSPAAVDDSCSEDRDGSPAVPCRRAGAAERHIFANRIREAARPFALRHAVLQHRCRLLGKQTLGNQEFEKIGRAAAYVCRPHEIRNRSSASVANSSGCWGASFASSSWMS